ncbi:MAG TPA: hypothetical protein VIV60_23585 [Polyangiaceae bacterium]
MIRAHALSPPLVAPLSTRAANGVGVLTAGSWAKCGGRNRAAAVLDEHLVIAENDRAVSATGLTHSAAEGGQIGIGVHDVALDGLARGWIEAATVEGDPHPGKIRGTTEVGPRQGILHSGGFPITVTAVSPRGFAHRAWLSIAPDRDGAKLDLP